MKKKLKFVAWILLLALVVIQFFRIDKTNPSIDPNNDFITIERPDENLAATLKAACYDCHSNLTKYPWYTNVAPISFWVKGHIDHGRGNLNFSEWGTYSQKKKNHKLEEMIEFTEQKWMPLSSYTWIHSEARLSKEQRTTLVSWFKTL